MATGGIKTSHFDIGSGIHLTVSCDNIIYTSATTVAVGEDKGLCGAGAVSTCLLENCPHDYKQRRDSLKKKTRNFEIGRVYPCTFKKGVSGNGKLVGFNTVYYVIVPHKSSSDSQGWIAQMTELYGNLFHQACNDGKSSLALPLLGSGGAGASVADAVKVFIQSLKDAKPRSLKDVSLHINPKDQKAFRETTELIKKLTQSSAVTQKLSSVSHEETSAFSSPSKNPACRKKCDGKKQNQKSSVSLRRDFANINLNDSSNLTSILGEDYLKPHCINNEENAKDASENDDDEDSADGTDKDFEMSPEDVLDKNIPHKNEEDEKCPICLDEIKEPKKLDKCGHTFCTECIEDTFRHHKPVCPTCNTLYGVIIGNQPVYGNMSVTQTCGHVPGFGNCGVITIDYSFPDGIQGKEHPNPGYAYRGTWRRAYLPNNEEGKKVCRLLRVAFDNRLTFTVGTSKTTGADNVVTWNDIHHKTSLEGGPTRFGYPDPHYLSRVQEELAARGITEDCLRHQRKIDVY